jgi:hypothetical protein
MIWCTNILNLPYLIYLSNILAFILLITVGRPKGAWCSSLLHLLMACWLLVPVWMRVSVTMWNVYPALPSSHTLAWPTRLSLARPSSPTLVAAVVVPHRQRRRAVSTKHGQQSIEGYARDGDLSVDRCARHEPDDNRTQDTRFIQVQVVSMT